MHQFIHVFIHIFTEAMSMIPFLLLAYLFIEYMEHNSSNKIVAKFKNMGSLGPVAGAIMGCIPQCGFSAAASKLYSTGFLTAGTLIAIFISTSDEALPIIIAHPDMYSLIWQLILSKIFIAVIVGIIIDKLRLIPPISQDNISEMPCIDGCTECNHKHHSHSNIWVNACFHTVKTFCLIFAIMFILHIAMDAIGSETISKMLMQNTVFQPILSALFGLIPSCAVSVVITQLFIAGNLSFGSLLAGLCTNAGVGLVVLCQNRENTKNNIKIIFALYVAGAVSGIIFQLFA